MTGQGLRGPETRLNVFRLRLQRLRLSVRPRPSVAASAIDRGNGLPMRHFFFSPGPSPALRRYPPSPYVRVRGVRPHVCMHNIR